MGGSKSNQFQLTHPKKFIILIKLDTYYFSSFILMFNPFWNDLLVIDVFIPKPIAISDSAELFHHDDSEQVSWTIIRCLHQSPSKQIHIFWWCPVESRTFVQKSQSFNCLKESDHISNALSTETKCSNFYSEEVEACQVSWYLCSKP